MKLPPHKTVVKSLLALSAGCLMSASALAETTRVTVTVENVGPTSAALATPVWVGLHDGSTFDTYNGNTLAGSLPNPGSVNALGQSAMESICEDGSTAQIAADFALLQPFGLDTTLLGPNGAIAPGETAQFTFTVDSLDPSTSFFSYASMLIPSNDFCVSNGNPAAHPIFDENGNFIATDFFVQGGEVLDAGTEVNDEIPGNTAAFGQQAPNTGVDENGLLGRVGNVLRLNPARVIPPARTAGPDGVLQAGADGELVGFIEADGVAPITILEDPRFAMSNFQVPGYTFLKFSFEQEAAPTIVEDLDFRTVMRGRNEVPSVSTRTVGTTEVELREQGTALNISSTVVRLPADVDLTMAHLHLGAEGENGPVIADFLNNGSIELVGSTRRINAQLDASNLVGPLAGQTLSSLVEAIREGNVYVNIHTDRNPAGEVRGQLSEQ